MLGERDLAEEKQSRVRAQRGNDISNRYSYGYVVGGWVSAQRGCDGTLPGARPYPKSVDQGRQHYVDQGRQHYTAQVDLRRNVARFSYIVGDPGPFLVHVRG